MGVWIETVPLALIWYVTDVTPFVGVWIETETHDIAAGVLIVTPFVGVWIETSREQYQVVDIRSHPSWVCGLKHLLIGHVVVSM